MPSTSAALSAEGVAAAVDLPLRVGARTLGTIRRRLVRLSVGLEQALAGEPLLPPGLPPQADGYFIRALPADQQGALRQAGLRPYVRSAYPRHYAALDRGFETYLGGFSAKTRQSLKRKRRKLEERSGGALDVRAYTRPDDMAEFHRHARAVSALTYQERRLDAGLPADALPEMQALAARDEVRGWLLFLDERPVSYLYAPARGETLVYAYLGYDPDYADLSVGTVLQLEAMRQLMEERRFRWFDFTEGDGQHKRQFATGAVDSVDLLLLRPTWRNRRAMAALGGFDRSIAAGKRLVSAVGLGGVARALRR
jgi:CelD/BcsL family acetyltransferase involved in cellulose biosynthesis